jgi:general secretion pathway protein M
MKAWWMSLQTRERIILTVSAIILVLILIYLLIIEPYFESRAMLANNIQGTRQTLVWMQQARQQVNQLRAVTSPRVRAGKDKRSLLALVDITAKRRKIRTNIHRMEPQGRDGIKLTIDDVDFDKLIHWIGSIQLSQGVNVTRATVSRSDTPGLIDARLSLQRP